MYMTNKSDEHSVQPPQNIWTIIILRAEGRDDVIVDKWTFTRTSNITMTMVYIGVCAYVCVCVCAYRDMASLAIMTAAHS